MIVKQIKATETFDAFHKAEKFAKSKGYSSGRMCRDEPIALVKGDCLIAKWYDIGREEYHRIDGLILSKEFRDGNVCVVLFEDKERYDQKVDYKALIKE